MFTVIMSIILVTRLVMMKKLVGVVCGLPNPSTAHKHSTLSPRYTFPRMAIMILMMVIMIMLMMT